MSEITHQCPDCDTPHNNATACPACRSTSKQIKLCPTHFTGYSPACPTCRALAGV